jgi:hypothetical protein
MQGQALDGGLAVAVRAFADGEVRVEFPPALDVREHDRRTRSIDGHAAVSRSAVTEQLTQSGFEVVADLDVRPTRALEGDPTLDAGPVTLNVAVSPEQASVVLLERDGVWSWHLPTTGQRGDPASVAFELPSVPSATGDRGLAGAGSLVLRFAAPVIDGLAIKVLEGDVSEGLVHLRGADPDSWSTIDTISDVELPAKPRILLLVHGTFSSTKGAFARFGEPEGPGRAFLEQAIATYDAVLGFDHPTLSVDPSANAEDLYRRLCAQSPAGLAVDVISHSRGGLVVRSLVESLLPSRQWSGSVGRIVFVGVPNDGTHFADPSRWPAFIDLYTNILMAQAAPVVGGQGTLGNTILGAGLKGVGALVKYLATYAVDGGGVPGLAAMEPGGDFLAMLNLHQLGQPGPAPPWFAVTSNFHVTDGAAPAEFPAALKRWLSEGVVDTVLDGTNDLVVDTESMSAIDDPRGGFLRDSLDFGANPVVYHLNYFMQARVGAALHAWLIDRSDQWQMAEAAMEADNPTIPQFDGGRDRGIVFGGGGGDVGDAAGGEEAAILIDDDGGDGVFASAPPPDDLVHAHVRAEMPAKITVAVSLKVRVILSRKEIPTTPDTIIADDVIGVPDGETFTVQIKPKRNVTISGSDVDQIVLPPGSGTSAVEFDVVATVAGPVEVTALLRRPSGEVLANLTLRGEAREPNDPDRRRRTIQAQVVAAAGTSVILDEAVWLEIWQVDGPGFIQFQYELRLPDHSPSLHYDSPRLRDHERFVADLFADIERAGTRFRGTPNGFRNFLQSRGSDLFERLFPEDMQAKLWDLRDELKTVLLMADEPYFPWEIVHLKPPVGPRQQEPRFLAQYGLLRWQFLSFPATPELRARPGKVFSVCPRKVDPRFVLVESLTEAEFLADKLGATDLRASDSSVRHLLRRGGFDVLHFSGHGAADTEDVASAVIMLNDRKVNGVPTRQFLSSTTVAETARLSAADGTGPLVVLNACQVGIGGEQLSSLGGFARAFLQAGAQAFAACLWSVEQQPSRIFVEALYEQLIDGQPLGEAVMRARDVTRAQEDSANWLAYVVYGRPDAKLVLR